jgi:hypothetical protein
MGSGNENRKKSDTTSIRRPKAFSGLGLSATAGEEYNADVCVPSFDVLIKDLGSVNPGMAAYLKKDADEYFITVAGSIISPLPTKYSKMVKRCLEMGVKYTGEIISVKTKMYARFIRVL